MTDQATQKRYVRLQLENMWKRYSAQVRLEDHELVILAVPTYPANIEAVSALDLSDINDLMAVFAKHREDHPDDNELHAFEQAAAVAQDEAVGGRGGASEDGRANEAAGEQQMGSRDDGGGASQERAEPAPEQNEGDASLIATELGDLIEALESTLRHVRSGAVMDASESMHNVDRSFGRWRRAMAVLPRLAMAAMSPEELLDLENEYNRSPGYITWVRDHGSVCDPIGTPLRGDGISESDKLVVEELIAQVPKPKE